VNVPNRNGNGDTESINNTAASSPFLSSIALSRWNRSAEERTNTKKNKGTSAHSNEKKHGSGKKFENILSHLAFTNILNKNKMESTTIVAEYEKAKLKYCFELADIVITPEQKDNLFCVDKSKVINAASEIAKACMYKLAEYDNQKYNPTSKKSKTTTGYTGMGRRLTAYKKQLTGILQNGNEPKNQPLMDRDVAEGNKTLTVTSVYGRGGTHSTLTVESATPQNDNDAPATSLSQSTSVDDNKQISIDLD